MKTIQPYKKKWGANPVLFRKIKDAIKLHQEKYNANSVIPHNVLASDYLTDCHQALFFQQDTLVY